MKQEKKVHGYLIDPDSKEVIAEGTVFITITPPLHSISQSELRASMIANGYNPNLCTKDQILKLNENISGLVQVVIDGFPGKQTKYTLQFLDPFWFSPQWLESL